MQRCKNRHIFQSWRICEKQLAATRVMCSANVDTKNFLSDSISGRSYTVTIYLYIAQYMNNVYIERNHPHSFYAAPLVVLGRRYAWLVCESTQIANIAVNPEVLVVHTRNSSTFANFSHSRNSKRQHWKAECEIKKHVTLSWHVFYILQILSKKLWCCRETSRNLYVCGISILHATGHIISYHHKHLLWRQSTRAHQRLTV